MASSPLASMTRRNTPTQERRTARESPLPDSALFRPVKTRTAARSRRPQRAMPAWTRSCPRNRERSSFSRGARLTWAPTYPATPPFLSCTATNTVRPLSSSRQEAPSLSSSTLPDRMAEDGKSPRASSTFPSASRTARGMPAAFSTRSSSLLKTSRFSEEKSSAS